MPLARLENFLKNLNGNTLYVDPNELDSTDSIENRGNSRLRPFKTIQRALIEAARFAYVPGVNNDLFDQTTIFISSGTHYIDNRPGYWVDGSNVVKDVNGATKNISEFNISSNFDLTDPSNQLYVYNSLDGGVIVPKGTSIVAQDLRKTKIRPKFVPNPVDDNIDPAAIFKLTGACYIFGFTIFDADPIGKAYNGYSSNTVTPNFSHHKLTAFEYADDANNIIKNNLDTGHTDLENYYYKLSLGFGAQSGRSVIDGFGNLQANVDENRIVGELGTGSIVITSAVSGNGTSGTAVITIQTQSPHNLSPFTPIIISGLGQNEGPTTELEYNGNFIVAQVVSATQFTYLLSNVPTQTLNPSVIGATVKVISDTVSSASPYVFNCSLKSVYGMNGLHADGSKAKGFKSMVTAQFTGISLQKDDRAFTEYDEVSGSYKFQDNFGVDKFLHQSSSARYRPSWETFHIKASNDSFIQCVSIFAIGYAKQFVTDTGGDQSITNSNSNFGQIALFSSDYKKDTLAKDNHAYITHIIQPKDLSQIENNITYVKINSSLTTTLSAANQKTRVYFDGYTDVLTPPPNKIRGYTIGAKENDKLLYKTANVEYSIPINPSYRLEYNVSSIDTSTNIIILSGISGISTGCNGKIIAKNAILPDGLDYNKLYNVRLTGGNGIRLYNNATNAENDVFPVDIKNQIGISTGNLVFVSSINEKKVGDVGHPIQFDTTNQNWYVGVNSVGLGATSFFSTLASIGPTSSLIKRKIDSRSNIDKAYRFRFFVPKEASSASDISSGFAIQRSSNSLSSLLYQAESEELISNSNNEISLIRNKGAIIDAWYDTGTVTIVTSRPHNLKVGDHIQIYQLKSSSEPNPVGLGTGFGYNGGFTVNSVVNELRFTYTITRDPGTITVGVSTTQSWLTVRDCAQTSNYRIPPYTIYDANRNDLPYFVQKTIPNDYVIYDVDTISRYEEGVNDGIYHVTVNLFKNTPTITPFNTSSYKLSQSVQNLYPQLDLDNSNPDPEGTISKASRSQIGIVNVNDVKNNTTKEIASSFLRDFNLGQNITGITTYQDTIVAGGVGVCTATTSINHGFGGVKRLTISSGGSAFLNGTYYDIPLCGGTGANATANITVSGNIVTGITIQNFGSGYTVGDALTLRGIPGSPNTSTVIVAEVKQSPSDLETIQILGCTNSRNNGTFLIKSITSNTITYYNNLGYPETPEQGVILLGGPAYQIRVSPDGAVYDSGTNTTTIVTQQSNNFAVGNKVIFDDQIGPTPSIGVCTITNVIGITSFTVRGDASSANRVYGFGLSSNIKNTDSENENVASRHFAIYGGYKARINQSVTVSDNNFLISDIYGIQKGDMIQVNTEIMLVTKVSGGEIYVRRGQLGTKVVPHLNQTAIKRISIVPVELRRNSIIRASGHTFEYVGFGPGNYSTGMPSNQDKILTDEDILTSQSLSTKGGLVVYTGMNSNGEFFIGKTKFDAVTGSQTQVGIPTEDEESLVSTSLSILDVNSLVVNDTLDASTAFSVFKTVTVEGESEFVGVTTFTSTQAATSTTVAAVIVSGGVAIGDDLIVGNDAKIDNITVGLTSSTTIDTVANNLYLNSAGGTVNVTDNLGVSGTLGVTGNSTLGGTLGVTGNSTLGGTLGVTGNTTITGNLVVSSPSTISGKGTIPVGGIIMWSGSIATIPTGWALCDGTNSTPNLRNRFVVCAGDTYAVAATGGTADAVVVSHSHTTSVSGNTAVTNVTGNNQYAGGSGFALQNVFSNTITPSVSVNSEGESGTNKNLPPYYALAYIMRTS